MSQVRNFLINDPILTTVAYGYAQGESLIPFIAPTVTVPARSGKIIQFGREQFAVTSTKRTPYADHKRAKVSGYSSASYILENHTHTAEVSWEEIESAEASGLQIDLKELAVMDALTKIEQSLEVELYDLITNPANFEPSLTVTVTGTNQFSNAGSDPEALVFAWKKAVRQEIGRYPTRAVISEDVYNALILHPIFRDRIKYTSIQSSTLDMLAAWLGLPGGIQVATRLRWNPATNTLSDMFPAGTMLLFVGAGDKDNQIGSSYEKNVPLFVQQPNIGLTTATFAQLYTVNDGLSVGKERINEDNDTVSHTVRFTGAFVLPSIGSTNKSAAGFLASGLI